MPVHWEALEHNIVSSNSKDPYFSLKRAKVPGGWLVTFFKFQTYWNKEKYEAWAYGAGFGGMTFVPDPNHVWDGNSLP